METRTGILNPPSCWTTTNLLKTMSMSNLCLFSFSSIPNPHPNISIVNREIKSPENQIHWKKNSSWHLHHNRKSPSCTQLSFPMRIGASPFLSRIAQC
ncbi:hypothetical protein I7I53_05055 [Histoplasma capsulatum var. duboisii H88]|uniref:Uncharacterized protein n=1 Tax=Ajellomyces capsulatus (strain H88) TaxID=544711 RepID=A0A8A1LW32_AJEC8|nr:hypothetical protein I7I53_05055 [Histoplasma capsulatum var. duboisii H88]